MAKAAIIRNFLVAQRQELPTDRERLRKHITDISRDLNFRLTGKEIQTLLDEFAPEAEKKPEKGPKISETTEALPEQE